MYSCHNRFWLEHSLTHSVQPDVKLILFVSHIHFIVFINNSIIYFDGVIDLPIMELQRQYNWNMKYF